MREELKPVLEKVNEMRAALGYEPLEELPRGKKQWAQQCVIAKALHATSAGLGFIGVDSLGKLERLQAIGLLKQEPYKDVPRSRLAVMTPLVLREFIDAFDHGKYPELEE